MTERKWEYIIVHCAATPPSKNFQASDIDRMHRQQGWRMCGYHEVICRDGQRQNHERGHKTRPLTMTGSHVGGCGNKWNAKALGICLIGGVDDKGKSVNNFTEVQFASLVEAVAYYMDRYDIPKENVMGHRDLIRLTNSSPKDCPCFDASEFLFNIKPEDLRIDHGTKQ